MGQQVPSEALGNCGRVVLRTSTSSRIATTKTSRGEFLHPTTTPDRSDLRMSVGQNILIKPSLPCMTESRAVTQLSKRASSSQLFSSRHAGGGGSGMLQHENRQSAALQIKGGRLTKLASRAAKRSTGTKTRPKTNVKIRKPFAARVWSGRTANVSERCCC